MFDIQKDGHMEKTKNFMTKRNGILFGAMVVVAIGIMVVFIVGMLNSSMWIALGGFFGGAVILIILMMIIDNFSMRKWKFVRQSKH